jgi:hypothetical protein
VPSIKSGTNHRDLRVIRNFFTRLRANNKFHNDKERKAMRCARCGNELLDESLKCAKCNLATPKGKQSPSTDSSKSPANVSNKRSSAKGKGKAADTTPEYLPQFLANSPLAKIKVSKKWIVPVATIMPILTFVYYLMMTNQICLGCVEVSGRYITDVSINNKPVKMQIDLAQTSSVIDGQILVTLPEQTRQVVEIIQQGRVSGGQLTFQTYPRNDQPSVNFSGQFSEDTLKGELKITLPELGGSPASVTVDIKRQ